MTKEKQTDTHVLRDGAITLYLRGSTTRNIWQARIKKPRGTGNIRFSTKTAGLAEASNIAEDTYEDMRQKAKLGLPVDISVTYQTLYDAWWKSEGRLKKPERSGFIRKQHDSYLLPYFGKLRLDYITARTVTDYWDWRLNYWTTGPG